MKKGKLCSIQCFCSCCKAAPREVAVTVAARILTAITGSVSGSGYKANDCSSLIVFPKVADRRTLLSPDEAVRYVSFLKGANRRTSL